VGKAVDLGNACDVGFTEVLEYFENDPDIRLIALYVESVRDGRRFKQVAHRVARKKPILALKAGRSALGAQVARSHTGSLMGKDEVYDAVFKQCGIIRVKDVEELEDLLMAFLYLPPITGRKVGIISNSGAAGIMATDACQEYGLELAQFSLQTKERIKGELPSWMKVRNPLDVWAASSYTGHNNTEVFKMVLENLMRDQNVDAVLITRSLTPGELDVSEAVLEIASTFRSKPIVCWIYGAYESRPGDVAAKLERSGKVVVFPTCERATRALAKLAQYLQFLQR
jgi:acetyltransferase